MGWCSPPSTRGGSSRPSVLVCALQDVVAFTIVLERTRLSSRRRTVGALVAFGAAFPFGAGVASTVLDSLEGSGQEALAVVRAIMSAAFLYMASELAPAHTHSRRRNLLYVCLFGLGVVLSSLAEMVEGLAQMGE